MIAAGIDIGGTKIEAQLFDQEWRIADKRRIATPKDYPGLISAIADQISWASATQSIPVGIGAAGLINPQTGLALTANLAASGKPWAKDIAKAAGRAIPLINDCRAMTLSEAQFGAGRGYNTVLGFALGTGIAGGLAQGGKLVNGQDRVGGEFGHLSAPAHLVVQHRLPIVRCGCGRIGCFETLASGPGFARIAKHLIGRDVSLATIAAQRSQDATMQKVWSIWIELIAAMLSDLVMAIDPDVIVLGGGPSHIDGVLADVSKELVKMHFDGFPSPDIALAQGGDASCARGAAYHAWGLT